MRRTVHIHLPATKDAALEGWRLDDVRRVAKEFANEGRTESEFISLVSTRYGVKTTAEQTIARQAFAAAKSGKTADYRPGDLVKARPGNIGEGVPGRVIRSYEERGRTFVEYQTKNGKQTSEEKDLERASTQDASFRLVDMDGHDWGTWSAGNVDDAIRLLRADVARRPKAYMGQPNYESIRKAVRMGGADSKDAASKVVARSKRGTVEEFIEGAGGAQPRTKYYARLSGGQNLGSFNSIENAKQAIESHGVQNATSGRQVTPLQWSSTDATAPLSFVISEVEHNGDESGSLDDLRKAGCTNILVTARNYENGVIRVSCTPPAGVTSKQQLQAKLSYAVLDCAADVPGLEALWRKMGSGVAIIPFIVAAQEKGIHRDIADLFWHQKVLNSRDALNHLGEREYQTYAAWRTAARAAGATRFEGDKDIASAFNAAGKSVGEWGGDVGSIYKTKDAKTNLFNVGRELEAGRQGRRDKERGATWSVYRIKNDGTRSTTPTVNRLTEEEAKQKVPYLEGINPGKKFIASQDAASVNFDADPRLMREGPNNFARMMGQEATANMTEEEFDKHLRQGGWEPNKSAGKYEAAMRSFKAQKARG